MEERERHVPAWRRKIQGSLIGNIVNSKVGSFAIIGILLTIFGAVFIRFARGAGWDPDDANKAQALISIVLNFILNYLFTWDDEHFLSFRNHVARFVASKFVTYEVNKFLFSLSMVLFHVLFGVSIQGVISDDNTSYIISTGIITLLNYPIMKYFVFGHNDWATDLGRTVRGIINLPRDMWDGTQRLLQKVRT